MRFRRHLSIAVCAAAVGCGVDRPTAPDESARAAAELERAAAEMGFATGPAGALTFQSTAAALRGGARATTVDITIDGRTEKWNAFGHEIQLESLGTEVSDVEPPPPMRSLLAWRSTSSGVRVIHLLAATAAADLGDPLTGEPDDQATTLVLPSGLTYAEGRNLVWVSVRGRQTSSVRRSSAACPAPPRPAGAPPAPPCVEASFTFGFSDVEAEPLVLPFGPTQVSQNLATGIRTLSMAPQTVGGVSVKLGIRVIGVPPIAGPAIP
ncbi:MAG: hypothetical protein ABR499_16070 [Gemmatimonadaceae bacterium]